MKTFRTRPSKYRVGDRVITIAGKVGTITAVGISEHRMGDKWRPEATGLLYRVGRNQWWSEWQISRRIAAVKEMP